MKISILISQNKTVYHNCKSSLTYIALQYDLEEEEKVSYEIVFFWRLNQSTLRRGNIYFLNNVGT
jgi:hypothetical protein